jgi:signal transduction histidine kinase
VDGGYTRVQGGDTFPFSSRAIIHRNTVFPLPLADGSSTLYLRVATTSTMIVAPRFWQPQAFAQAAQREYLMWGCYFGVLTSVFLFGILNGFITGRRDYYAYGAYVLAQGLEASATSGLLGQFVFSDAPQWANASVGVTIACSVIASSLLFSWLFRMRENYPKLHRLYQAIIGVAVVTLFAAMTPYYGYLAFPMIMMTLVAALWTLKPAWDYLHSQGGTEQRWLGGAFVIFAVMVTGNITNVLGLIPISLVTIYAHRLLALLFVLIMHVGVLMMVRESEKRRHVALDSVRDAERSVILERRAREERDQFLSMFNHEVRTPLSIIRASTQSLELLDPSPEPSRQSRYRNILEAVDRTQKLVELCLTTDRFDTGNWVSSPVPTDLCDLTRTTLSLLGTEVYDRVQFLGSERAPIMGDPELIRIVFLNLLDNAFKYSRADSAITITIDDSSGGLIDWVIENEGSAWAPGDEERLFDKYFRVAEHAGQPGLGLGLFLVRRIMEMHDGRITAELHENGPRFRCRFPTRMTETP